MKRGVLVVALLMWVFRAEAAVIECVDFTNISDGQFHVDYLVQEESKSLKVWVSGFGGEEFVLKEAEVRLSPAKDEQSKEGAVLSSKNIRLEIWPNAFVPAPARSIPQLVGLLEYQKDNKKSRFPVKCSIEKGFNLVSEAEK